MLPGLTLCICGSLKENGGGGGETEALTERTRTFTCTVNTQRNLQVLAGVQGCSKPTGGLGWGLLR